MNADQFYKTRQADWQKLSHLLKQSQSDIKQLSPAEVKELGQLYRAATSDLALAQRDFPQHRVTTFLNQLVAQGHGILYQSEPLALKRLRRYFLQGLPQAFRDTWRFTAVSALLLILPALIAGIITNWNPDAASAVLPAEVQGLIPQIEEQDLWVDIPIEERPYVSSFIMTNNIRVSFLAFASGVTAGLLTVYVLIHNGILLGGLTGLTAHHDVGLELWNFVIGHGVIELTTIFIAGGSGLMLGWAIINPGLLRRRDALTEAAKTAVKLIVGCVPILVIAGIIEGFISPNENIPPLVKWGVGIGTGLLLYSYLLFVGRQPTGSLD
ncbi:MAG: stage II sporulation protein M [Chloroflexota bacterium]